MKPILYLDIDGVVLDFPKSQEEYKICCATGLYKGFGAAGVAEFLRQALMRFEVRWLTSWAHTGRLQESQIEYLAKATCVEEILLRTIVNPRRWWDNKLEGIDFNDPRPCLWLEDGLPQDEYDAFRDTARPDQNYVFIDVTSDTHALRRVVAEWRAGELFNLTRTRREPC